jgi:hypothetical protein
MDQHQYRLLEPNEDYTAAVIEKSGIKATFTIAEVNAMQERNKAAEREIEGQLTIERAKVDNILRNYPQVGELEGVVLTAAALYKESLTTIAAAESKLPLIKDAIKVNDDMVADVIKQFNLNPDGKETSNDSQG